jgi:hypothetical protein
VYPAAFVVVGAHQSAMGPRSELWPALLIGNPWVSRNANWPWNYIIYEISKIRVHITTKSQKGKKTKYRTTLQNIKNRIIKKYITYRGGIEPQWGMAVPQQWGH